MIVEMKHQKETFPVQREAFKINKNISKVKLAPKFISKNLTRDNLTSESRITKQMQ